MKFMKNAALLLLACLALSPSAHALKQCPSATTIDARLPTYQTAANLHVTVADSEEVRSGVLTSAIGMYRLQNGILKLPVGSMIKMIYRDGSRECAAVISRTGTPMGDPIPDTARRPGDTVTVEDTIIYIKKYQFERPAGSAQAWFNVCYDYYTNGVLTDSECHIEPF